MLPRARPKTTRREGRGGGPGAISSIAEEELEEVRSADPRRGCQRRLEQQPRLAGAPRPQAPPLEPRYYPLHIVIFHEYCDLIPT